MILPAEYSDRELVSACTSGQSWAWDALIDRYKRLVYSIPLRAGLTEQDAADVFQTVFTRLFEHLRSMRDPQGLAAWLITTAKRESWGTLRKRRHESTDGEIEKTLASAKKWLGNTHPDEDRWIDQALVRDAMEHLGGRCKELLWLLYYDPHQPSYKEVSGRVKMPLGSIGPTRARCLQKLRRIIESMGMGET